MPYARILKGLLEKVEGAIGVGFVAYDGETVQLEGHLEDFTHRLHLAYQGILLQNIEQIHKRHGESLSSVILVHQNLTLVIKPLKGGYSLVLTLQHRKNLYKALRSLDRAAQELNQEL